MKKARSDFGFVAYSFVVLVGFSVDFLVYSTMVFMGRSILVANLVGFSVGSVLNVVLIRKLVFTPKFKLSKDVLLTLGLNGFLFLLGTLCLWWLVTS